LRDHITAVREPSAPNALVDQVAQLCACAIADVCAIYRGPGELPQAFAARDPARFKSLRFAAYDDLYPERAHTLGLTSVVWEPLVADNLTLGVIVLASQDDLAPSDQIGKMAASVVAALIAQDARLAHHKRLSDRLQRAMLPQHLAELSDGWLDAAYSPASGESEVGGDWYDAFELSDGRIGISIGDETGHGLEAAVAMSEIRHALRSAAATSKSTTDILNTVDEIIASREIGMATAIVGVYDRITHTLQFASAGHPQPALVTASGATYLLPAGGTLLGLGLRSASPQYTVTLSPGTTCVLYTDGLIECKRDIVAGEADFIAMLETLAREGRLSAQELHDRIVGDGPLDDCATLMLNRADSPNARRERYVFSALPSFARIARDAIRHFALRRGISESATFDILIASGEGVANAIEHGSQQSDATFTIEIAHEDGRLVLDIANIGHWRASAADDSRGRGLSIMRAYASTLQVSSNSEHTRVGLTFAI
jgi:anti-sigma regulatory factor (Ser/Thr protein kinase)